jgi:hypothetical protein
LTPDDVGDVSDLPDLLDQIEAEVASMTADGAYDGEAVYDAVAERHPNATVSRRSLFETAMFRYKTIIGRKLQARTLSSQKTEAKIGCDVLNRMTGLGMRASAPGPLIREPGQETPPAADPCTNAVQVAKAARYCPGVAPIMLRKTRVRCA